jgi:hypothetical protein
MTCPDFIFSKRGRAGIGVVQPQSGLDYPFVSLDGFSQGPVAGRVVYPVYAKHAGGAFHLHNPTTNQTIFGLSPTFGYGETTVGNLYTFGVITAPNTSATVSYLSSVDAAKLANPGYTQLTYASFELVLIDSAGQLVGWGTTSSTGVSNPTNGTGGYYMTISVNSFPTVAPGWVLSGCCPTLLAAVYTNPTPYKTLAANDIRYQLADFHLSFDDLGEYDPSIEPVRYPLRVKYLYGVGCTNNSPPPDFFTPSHSADVLLVDANDRTVFNTAASGTTFSTKAWGDDYRIYEWKSATAVCRAVAYTTWPSTDNSTPDEDTPRHYPKYLSAANAILDSRAVYKLPKRLLSLRTRNGQTISPRYKNNFTFLNGFNTTLPRGTTTTTDLRVNTPITFSAVAGSGKGKFGNCGDVPTVYPIARINGTPAEQGHYLMAAKDCLWVRRPTNAVKNPAGDITSITPSTTAGLQAGADCDPCCGCEDYADTAKYMNSTSYRYKLIGQRAGTVRTEHENNIARWLDYRACSIQQPLRLLLVPQRCPYIDVAMMLCNTCDNKCFGDSVLTLDLSVGSTATTTVELECGHTALYAPNINGQAIGITQLNNGLRYSAALPELKSGESAYVRFRIKITEPNPDDPTKQGKARGPYPITGVLTGTINGVPILTNCGEPLEDNEPPLPASAESTQILYCNSAGQTEAPC